MSSSTLANSSTSSLSIVDLTDSQPTSFKHKHSDTTNDPSLSQRPSREVTKYSQAALKNPNKFVVLFAGESNKKLAVHKDFACHYCPVLRAAFNSEFIEGQTQEYRLQDTTEEVIRQLINWFYTQKLDINQLGPDGNLSRDEIDINVKRAEDMCLVELWILAEKLLILRLQNLVIREMARLRVRSLRSFSMSTFNVIYEKTHEGSAIRRYVAAAHAHHTWIEEDHEKYLKQMLVDIILLLQDKFTPKVIKDKMNMKACIEDFEVPED